MVFNEIIVSFSQRREKTSELLINVEVKNHSIYLLFSYSPPPFFLHTFDFLGLHTMVQCSFIVSLKAREAMNMRYHIKPKNRPHLDKTRPSPPDRPSSGFEFQTSHLSVKHYTERFLWLSGHFE